MANGDNKWFVRIAVTAMFGAMTIMSGMLWNISAEEDKRLSADMQILEEYMDENLETKDSHEQDVELIEAKFEFIKEQLEDIKEAVKE